MTVYRHYAPGLKSYKLASLEKYYEIKRSSPEYKQSIFKMFADWKNPRKKQLAINYNLEDVTNLIRIKRKLFAHHNIKNKDLTPFLLKQLKYIFMFAMILKKHYRGKCFFNKLK